MTPILRVSNAAAAPFRGLDPFLVLLHAHDLPLPETEAIFHPTRKWRADYLWRHAMLIVERHGGLFAKGRAGMAHAMPTSIRRDWEKANAAQLLGYVILQFESRDLDSGKALEQIKEVLGPGASSRGPA